MAFIIHKGKNLTSIISTEHDTALTFVPMTCSISLKPEFYLTNLKADNLSEPYYDIEQALDDFEYSTTELSNNLISTFKHCVDDKALEDILKSIDEQDIILDIDS